jgi:di/tricarboxylate transporter
MLREKMLESIQQAAARSSDPQAQQAVEFFKTPQGLVTSLIVAAIFMFVAFIVLSAAGGAVGALLMRKKDSA